MKCIEVKENLAAFFDYEIDFSTREKIESHLQHCVFCQNEYANLKNLSHSLKQNLPIPITSSTLDKKVLSAFENFHQQKQEEKHQSFNWFGISKLAFASAFLLLALFSGLAFQIGRISASNVEISMPEINGNGQTNFDNKPMEQTPEIKIVEVPVVKEKIIKVRIIEEKIVTKTIYVEKKSKNSVQKFISPENMFALNSSVKDGEFLTTTNLDGFQPVSEIKATITKKEEEK